MRRVEVSLVVSAATALAVVMGSFAGAAAAPAAFAQPPELHYKDHNRVVQTLQNALNVKPLSGYFGLRTLHAVKAFQERMGIPVTGVADAATWNALGRRVSRNAERHAAGLVSVKPQSTGRVCPVVNPIFSDRFGADRGDRSHQGLDMLKGRGAKIYAVDNGVVTRAEWQGNGALAVDITGSRGMWFYGHFDDIVVRHGQRIKAGDLIGYMGDTGSYGAVHLHIEYHPGGDWPNPAVDPEPLLRSICK